MFVMTGTQDQPKQRESRGPHPIHPPGAGPPVFPRAQWLSGHVTRAPPMQIRCPGLGWLGGQAPPCRPQARHSGEAAPLGDLL